MALVVFDMGRRVETPVRPQKTRINPTQESERIAPVSDQEAAYGKSSAHYQPSRQQHQPQAVAYVADIMQRQVRWIYADATIGEAWQLMQKTAFHHIPVVDHDLKISAILSDRDLLAPGLKRQIDWQLSVLDFASRPVLCIAEDADIRQCARTLMEYNIGAMPVVNHEHILTGIITRTDILRVISHYGPMELWA